MGVCNEGKIYSISQTDNGFIVFFKDADGVIKKILLDKDYTLKNIEDCGFKNEILTINTLFYKGITYWLFVFSYFDFIFSIRSVSHK